MPLAESTVTNRSPIHKKIVVVSLSAGHSRTAARRRLTGVLDAERPRLPAGTAVPRTDRAVPSEIDGPNAPSGRPRPTRSGIGPEAGARPDGKMCR